MKKNFSMFLIAAVSGVALLLSGCRLLPGGEPAKTDSGLVKAEEKLNSLSYTADVTSNNKTYVCETLFRADGAVRRSWNWNENGKKRSYAETLIGGHGLIATDDGAAPQKMTGEQADSLLFFSNLFLRPDRALNLVGDAPDGKQIADDGFLCRAAQMSCPGIKDGTLLIAKDTGFWSTLLINKRDGSAIRVSFADYRKIGNSDFPAKIMTEFNGTESTAVIRDVRLNPELPDELFELQIK